MGYYTKYKLQIWRNNVRPSALELERIAEYVKGDEWYGDEYVRLVDGKVTEPIKGDIDDGWVSISRQFPWLLFALYGQGEDHGDVWVQYFWAGNRQRHGARFPGPNDQAWVEYEEGR
jgi:hypothetical protein